MISEIRFLIRRGGVILDLMDDFEYYV